MDFADYSRILSSRIKNLEPENVTKIIGYLLLQNGEQAIINLASSPDFAIQEAVFKAKTELNLLNVQSVPSPVSPLQYAPFSPGSTRSPLTRSNFQAPYHNPEFLPMNYSDAISELQNQTQFLSLEDQVEPVNPGFSSDYHFPDVGLKNLPPRMMARRFSGLNEFPNKTCHYFNKGFCKHGIHCRYSHAQIPEHLARIFDGTNDDHLFSPGSLEKLELEIVELLKSRKGNPVSIASLPNLYYEKYGKVLQAEGYLTESQRHGKAGYSLTKLLAKLRNSIRLIDRPHGQHSVIFAEDYAKYSENFGDRNPGPIVSGSRQIYLTFPAESTFTEDDVSNYFNTYGPVEDVRIPCQQNRMFGFVTFESAETVKMVLAKGNPHFVCGARVLVKPYREKSKTIDRKYQERLARVYFPSPYVDIDADLHSFPREHENSMLLRKRLMEEQEQALEFQRQLARLQAAKKPMANQSYFSYSMDRLKLSQDNFDFPSPDPYGFLFDGLNTDPVSDGKIRLAEANYTDQDSQAVNLPDSPFASLTS